MRQILPGVVCKRCEGVERIAVSKRRPRGLCAACTRVQEAVRNALNPDAARARYSRYNRTHRERRRAEDRERYRSDPIRAAAKNMLAHARKRGFEICDDLRTAAAHIQLIEQRLAREAETGIPHHWDHKRPLRPTDGGPAGKHTLSNLQLLTAAENNAKYNRVAPEAAT